MIGCPTCFRPYAAQREAFVGPYCECPTDAPTLTTDTTGTARFFCRKCNRGPLFTWERTDSGICAECVRIGAREALAAMKNEQEEDYADYVRRCGGVPISPIKP